MAGGFAAGAPVVPITCGAPTDPTSMSVVTATGMTGLHDPTGVFSTHLPAYPTPMGMAGVWY